MSNDDRPSSGKSTQAAQQNKISHRDRKHPWHLPYLKTCIIKNCRTTSATQAVIVLWQMPSWDIQQQV